VIEAAKQAGRAGARTTATTRDCRWPACAAVPRGTREGPKLQIACATRWRKHGRPDAVASGQSGRMGVLELLLINHPLDCRSATSGSASCRNFTFQKAAPPRVQPRLREALNPVEDFGPDVLYVPNRCNPVARAASDSWRTWRRAGASVLGRRRRPCLHRNPCRRAPRSLVGGQRRRSVSRRLPSSPRFPAQGARLGARQGGLDLHRVLAGVQRHARHARERGGARAPAVEPRSEPLFHLRPRAHETTAG